MGEEDTFTGPRDILRPLVVGVVLGEMGLSESIKIGLSKVPEEFAI